MKITLEYVDWLSKSIMGYEVGYGNPPTRAENILSQVFQLSLPLIKAAQSVVEADRVMREAQGDVLEESQSLHEAFCKLEDEVDAFDTCFQHILATDD